METNKKQFTNSSQVSAIEYFPTDKRLEVLYVQGKRYTYAEVPQEVWEAALKAESIGKFLNSEVKGKFQYRQI